MELVGIIESFIGTLAAGLILIVPIIYLIKKKLGSSPLGMFMQ